MAIMTAAEFHKRKNIFRKGHKNPIAEDIHTLLLAYEDQTNSPNRQIKILVLLYFLCLEYIYSKNQKKKKGFDPDSGKNKSNHVVVLMGQIEAETHTGEFQQQYQQKVFGEHYKNGRLVNYSGGGTQLKGSYGVETVAPQQNLIQKFNLSTTIPPYGMSLLSQVTEQDFQVNHGMGVQASEQAAHQKLANLSLTGLFKELHGLWHSVAVPKDMEFNFFDSTQRQQYVATCTGGVWSCNGKTPFSTNGRPMMYVMDLSNRLYIPDGIPTGDGTFNHSSMLSGKPVISAGTLEINGGGKLIYIDNDSGHYKPNTRALRDVVDILFKHYHITLFGVQVMDKATGNTVSAMKFLRDN